MPFLSREASTKIILSSGELYKRGLPKTRAGRLS